MQDEIISEVSYKDTMNRKPRVQATLDTIEHLRDGRRKVYLLGTAPTPVPVRNCSHCNKPAPMTACCQFVCRHCVLLFR